MATPLGVDSLRSMPEGNQGAAGLARDILPVKLPFDVEPVRKNISRSIRRRLGARGHWQKWANEGVAALNSLYGRSQAMDFDEMSAQQVLLMKDFVKHYQRCVPVEGETATGAFFALCGNKAGYEEVVQGLPIPYREGHVALPHLGSRPVDLTPLLGEPERWLWENWRSELLSEAAHFEEGSTPFRSAPHPSCSTRCDSSSLYCDPALVSNPDVYARFLSELHTRSIVGFGGLRDTSVGMFFVQSHSAEEGWVSSSYFRH
eukprot:2028582-Amphidinium_carterae.2